MTQFVERLAVCTCLFIFVALMWLAEKIRQNRRFHRTPHGSVLRDVREVSLDKSLEKSVLKAVKSILRTAESDYRLVGTQYDKLPHQRSDSAMEDDTQVLVLTYLRQLAMSRQCSLRLTAERRQAFANAALWFESQMGPEYSLARRLNEGGAKD